MSDASATTKHERPATVPKVTYRRQGTQDYQVWLDDCYVGTVWKAHRSGWYCSAGNAGYTNKTRTAATRLLLTLSKRSGGI